MYRPMFSLMARDMQRLSHPSVTGKNDCISCLSSQGSYAPMTFCGLPPGLVESQFLDESQMQWSSADTKPCHAQILMEINEQCPNYSNSDPFPDVKRPSKVTSKSTVPWSRSQKKCFAQRVPHHHSVQLLAAVMVCWPSLGRFGSCTLPRNHPQLTVFFLLLRFTHVSPSELLIFIRWILSHRWCHFSK